MNNLSIDTKVGGANVDECTSSPSSPESLSLLPMMWRCTNQFVILLFHRLPLRKSRVYAQPNKNVRVNSRAFLSAPRDEFWCKVNVRAVRGDVMVVWLAIDHSWSWSTKVPYIETNNKPHARVSQYLRKIARGLEWPWAGIICCRHWKRGVRQLSLGKRLNWLGISLFVFGILVVA